MAPEIRKNLHEGHRARLRRRFRSDGLDGFEDHQILELLLFDPIPRRDTNDLAHFIGPSVGPFANVLEADPDDLAQTEGVGEGAATRPTLIPALTRRYFVDRARQERHQVNSTERAAEFLVPFMEDAAIEAFYVICLDAQCRVIVPALDAEGSIDKAPVEPRAVVETALRHKAHSVILAHNHPSGTARPSTADHRVTRPLVDALSAIGIQCATTSSSPARHRSASRVRR